jgi:hypothetical protein
MSFVVARRDGRFEVRESIATLRGPRARTLATFRVLDDDVLRRAEARATRPFDRDLTRRRARAAGAPVAEPDAAGDAIRLLVGLTSGASLPPVLAAALRDRLARDAGELPDSIPPLAEWLGAGPAERGEALRELLRLTDRLPAPRRARRGRPFPRISSAGA